MLDVLARKMKRKLLYIGLGSLGAVVLMIAAGTLAVYVNADWHSAVYPGSRPQADSSAGKLRPNLYFQQKDFFVSGDSFFDVYRWYASQFGMTFETQYRLDCVSMYTKTIRLRIERVMRVTVCDMVDERTIFVERVIKISWP